MPKCHLINIPLTFLFYGNVAILLFFMFFHLQRYLFLSHPINKTLQNTQNYLRKRLHTLFVMAHYTASLYSARLHSTVVRH